MRFGLFSEGPFVFVFSCNTTFYGNISQGVWLQMEASLTCKYHRNLLKAFWYHLGEISRKAREPDSEGGCLGTVPTATAGSTVDAPRYTTATPSHGFL